MGGNKREGNRNGLLVLELTLFLNPHEKKFLVYTRIEQWL